ncbi:hypothetical protein D3C85_1647760 [compost metagenome]
MQDGCRQHADPVAATQEVLDDRQIIHLQLRGDFNALGGKVLVDHPAQPVTTRGQHQFEPRQTGQRQWQRSAEAIGCTGGDQ